MLKLWGLQFVDLHHFSFQHFISQTYLRVGTSLEASFKHVIITLWLTARLDCVRRVIFWTQQCFKHWFYFHPRVRILGSISAVDALGTYLRSWALLEEPPIVQPLKNFLLLWSYIQGIRIGPRLLVYCRNRLIFLRWGDVSPTPNRQAGEPPLVGWRASPSASWGRARPWWQGTHLTWSFRHTVLNCLFITATAG
jgi:hypothetical protein